MEKRDEEQGRCSRNGEKWTFLRKIYQCPQISKQPASVFCREVFFLSMTSCDGKYDEDESRVRASVSGKRRSAGVGGDWVTGEVGVQEIM